MNELEKQLREELDDRDTEIFHNHRLIHKKNEEIEKRDKLLSLWIKNNNAQSGETIYRVCNKLLYTAIAKIKRTMD